MALRGGLGPSLLYLAKIHDAKLVFPEAFRGELRQWRALLQHGTAISGQQQLPVNPPGRDAVAHHLLVKFT